MRVLVAVKRAIDYAAVIRLKPDRSGVETAGVKMSMNPFCENAVEEAVRLKERGVATEVVAATVGPAGSADVLRRALAMGADRAIHVEVERDDLDQLHIARILAALARRQPADLLLLGKQAIDSDMGVTGQMAAALLGWPQATNAGKLSVDAAARRAVAERETEGGRQTVALPLPAVVTADLRLNDPRFVSLPAMLRAKKAALERVSPGDLGVDTAAALTRLVRVDPPAPRPPGIRVGSVDELLAKLRERGAPFPS